MAGQEETVEDEDEQTGTLPPHMGTETGFAGMLEKKEDQNMKDAEQVVQTSAQIPTALRQVLSLPLRRNPAMRMKEKKIVDLYHPIPICIICTY